MVPAYIALIRLEDAVGVVLIAPRKLTTIERVDAQITIVKSSCITMCAAIPGSIVLR